MTCDKSRKRHIITAWAIREAGRGRPMYDIKADMRRMMKMRLDDVRAISVLAKIDGEG